jgi:hypothetical protein
MSMDFPLARQVVAALYHTRPLLRTSASIEILHEMRICFLARLTVKNLPNMLSSYSLGRSGRAEIRKREIGYSISARGQAPGGWLVAPCPAACRGLMHSRCPGSFDLAVAIGHTCYREYPR